MIKNKFHYGFTLIELLVVISIISMLASVVLVSLQSARQKAKDSSIIQSLSSARTEAEIERSFDGAYPSGLCLTLANKFGIAVQAQGGTGFLCTVNSNMISIHAVLNNSTSYCVDNSGYSGVGSGSNGSCSTGPVASISIVAVSQMGSYLQVNVSTSNISNGSSVYYSLRKNGSAIIYGNFGPSTVQNNVASFLYNSTILPGSGYYVQACTLIGAQSPCKDSSQFTVL